MHEMHFFSLYFFRNENGDEGPQLRQVANQDVKRLLICAQLHRGKAVTT